jgi:hypothetical protein
MAPCDSVLDTGSLPPTWEASVERLLALTKWSSFRVGQPPADGPETWLDYASFTDAASVHSQVVASAGTGEYAEAHVPEKIVGNYLFREVISAPLGFTGYLWAREGRVPALAANTTVKAAEWLQDWRWIAPAGTVLAGDPLASQAGVSTVDAEAALDDVLWAEVANFSQPILDAFRARRYVAPANGWGSILDSVAYGVELAGASDGALGLDGAWSRWGAAVEGRTFPVRRRPRRLQYEWSPGNTDELLVRSGCCLWYMTPDAKDENGVQDYCTSCYLKADAQRIEHLVLRKRREAAGEALDD